MNNSYMSNPVGILWAYTRGDPLPTIDNPTRLEFKIIDDLALLVKLTAEPGDKIEEQIKLGTCYFAYLNNEPVGFGWSVTGKTTFGQPPREIDIPNNQRYLKGYVTYPQFRGQNIYPRLLQHIVSAEKNVVRFWILHQIANKASERGIEKAGFERVGIITDLGEGKFGLLSDSGSSLAKEGAKLLNIEYINS